MKTQFTQEERNLLTNAGWEVKETVAYNGHRKIIKLFENDFEVEVWIDGDAESDNYWDFDSEWYSLEKAMRRA